MPNIPLRSVCDEHAETGIAGTCKNCHKFLPNAAANNDSDMEMEKQKKQPQKLQLFLGIIDILSAYVPGRDHRNKAKSIMLVGDDVSESEG